ncbi:MAG: ATP-binding cassette domain-containing protein [Bacillota bacterium]|nr:ATP-binding cassette domain-containing protein [Bacillota bacterium]
MSIEVKHLDFTYQPGTTSERHALKDVSLRVEDGELLAIIGASGSGKSTLVQHLNGAMMPPAGTVFVNGLELKKGVAVMEMVRRVGLVFQYPEHQLFAETVGEEIAYGCHNLGFSDAETDRATKRALSAVGLEESFLSRSPFHLSGGEKRRVALASVLAMDPPILILDEPTVGLDRDGKTMVRTLLKSLHEQGRTVLLVGHDMAEICPLARRLVVMDHGAVVADGDTDMILRSGNVAQYGITMPRPFHPREKMAQRFPEDCHSEAAEKILTFLEGGSQ